VRFQRLRVLFALVLREMDTRFGRSSGGYLWALGEPLGGILLLAVVFSLALRSPPLGSSFLLFYATGIVPFTMFKTMSGRVSGAVSTNKGLLTYPVVTVLDAVLAKFVLNLLTLVVIALILFAGIILILGLHINLDLGTGGPSCP
jgi:capsular polysaccharide transport system permease protein